MLWLFKINFHRFRRFFIHGNSSYVVLYTQCLRYNICSAWFLDIRISNCLICRKGGLVIQHHNEIRDAIGDLAVLAWGQVRRESVVIEAEDQ